MFPSVKVVDILTWFFFFFLETGCHVSHGLEPAIYLLMTVNFEFSSLYSEYLDYDNPAISYLVYVTEGDQVQGFVHAKQEFYYQSYSYDISFVFVIIGSCRAG